MDKDDVEASIAPTSGYRPWLNRVWCATIGTATLYLKKPVLPPVSEYRNLLMRRAPVDDHDQRRGVEDYDHQMRQSDNGVDYRNTRGSEVRLLRRVRIGEEGNLKKCPIDFGVGAMVTLDPEVKLKPVVRIRVADVVTMKLAPETVIKFSKTLPFHFQGMQAHLRKAVQCIIDMVASLVNQDKAVRYEVPLSGLRESWWKPPARMLVRFEHGSNSGFHFYPGGLEFGDHTIPLTEKNTTVIRVAAGLSFPREYPMHPQSQAKWEIYRLGLKTIW